MFVIIIAKKIFSWAVLIKSFFLILQNSNDNDKKEKDMNKSSSSPYETKKDEVNGNAPQTNGHATNGLADDDKTFK